MIIAVASQDYRTVTPHAGKTRRFLMFEATAGQPAREVGRLDLPETMTIHAVSGDAPHPLYQAQVILAGSAGEGFVRKMADHGVITVLTAETDPAEAVRLYVEGGLAAAGLGDVGPCGCHDHHHS